jgi:hypothetical protein
MERRPTNAELEGEERLLNRIDGMMEGGKRYFCRLSTRSPKDGVSVKGEVWSLVFTFWIISLDAMLLFFFSLILSVLV